MDQLRSSCGLQPAGLSKFEAGLLAIGQDIPGAPDLGPTAVSPESTIGELAYAVLRRQFGVLREKEPGTRLGEDIEELHDMRVATRRLRAALALFSTVLPVRAQTFREELGWLGRVLGDVRDLDVQIDGLADMTADTAALAAALPPAITIRWASWPRCSSASARRPGPTCSTPWTPCAGNGWPRAWPPWCSRARPGAPWPPGCPPSSRCPTSSRPATHAVVKAAKRAKKTGVVTDFHRLRIRGKRLRYALEFSSDVYGGRTARFVRQLTALQDELGRMQDAEVALPAPGRAGHRRRSASLPPPSS